MGKPGGMGGAVGRVPEGGGEGWDDGMAGEAGVGRVAGIAEAAVVNREAGAEGRTISGAGAWTPLAGTWTTA